MTDYYDSARGEFGPAQKPVPLSGFTGFDRYDVSDPPHFRGGPFAGDEFGDSYRHSAASLQGTAYDLSVTVPKFPVGLGADGLAINASDLTISHDDLMATTIAHAQRYGTVGTGV